MPRYRHNLSHEHKLSTDMGLLVPIGTIEALPGDTFIHQTNLLARVAPLVNPVMHKVSIRVHHWFVPNRILWSDWPDWIVGNSVATYPQIAIPASASDYALMDHMGLPQEIGENVSALPIRAYNKIWNEFYRDQDLHTERTEDQLGLARICWEKDYFTTARDVPQQGDAVQIPFQAGSQAPVRGAGMWGAGITSPSWDKISGDVHESGGVDTTPADTDGNRWSDMSGASEQFVVRQDADNLSYPDIYADLSQIQGGGIDVNDLRNALALQSFAEVRVRFGERYVDYLRYLGVNPGDTRMQRPEFLGGGSQDINFSEVLATAEGATTDVGDLYGHGIAGLRSRRYRRGFTEHGWVLSLLSVRPKTVYMNGILRKFSRDDPMEYWQRELEVLPWQEVKNSELYAAHTTPTGVFGYVPKYDEYRHEMSYVSGSFRSGPEIDWHMARNFTSEPTLNGSFVECTPTDRVYGDVGMPELLINARHSLQSKRLVRANAQFGAML